MAIPQKSISESDFKIINPKNPLSLWGRGFLGWGPPIVDWEPNKRQSLSKAVRVETRGQIA
jgi:hypothetical protein